MRTFPRVSFDDESGTARISCRTFTNMTQKRIYEVFRHFYLYDAFVRDVQTGTRAMLQSCFSREEGLQRVTKALIDRLISTGQMTESSSCLVPAYSSPLLLIQGACPPELGIKCDTVCEFACSDSSYTLVGSSAIRCQPNGTLSDKFPHCKANEEHTTQVTTTKTTSTPHHVVHTTLPSTTTNKHSSPRRFTTRTAQPENGTTPGSRTGHTTPSTTGMPSTTGSSTTSEDISTTTRSPTKKDPTSKAVPTMSTKADRPTDASSSTVPSTSSVPGLPHRFSSLAFIGLLGVPLLLLPAIFAIYKLVFRHRRKKYLILDETSGKDDLDDVPFECDGYYTAQKIKQAILTDMSIELNRKMCYAMDKPDKGVAFILNNYIFDTYRASERKGSHIDLVNVRHVFKEIGYAPEEAQNLTAEEIRMELNSLKQKILPTHTSVVLVFMSHGVPEGILGTDQKVVTVEEIKNMFSGNNCQALIGKPKIMFFQACRGDKVTPCASSNNTPLEAGTEKCDGIVSTDGLTTGGRVALAKDDGESSKPDRSMVKPSPDNIKGDEVDTDGGVPDNADVYIAHATSEGYFSLRDKQNGSWFIQALCEELIASAHAHHLDDIMMKVTDRVKQHEANIVVRGKRRLTLQTPQIVKQGIGKKIYFLPKYQPVHRRSKATELKSHL
ncbi:uncharacterized protein LOC129263184 isoform X2 [Lytechinus pictus]